MNKVFFKIGSILFGTSVLGFFVLLVYYIWQCNPITAVLTACFLGGLATMILSSQPKPEQKRSVWTKKDK